MALTKGVVRIFRISDILKWPFLTLHVKHTNDPKWFRDYLVSSSYYLLLSNLVIKLKKTTFKDIILNFTLLPSKFSSLLTITKILLTIQSQFSLHNILRSLQQTSQCPIAVIRIHNLMFDKPTKKTSRVIATG